jgi:tetratricopeptide (TPR) repeat protein
MHPPSDSQVAHRALAASGTVAGWRRAGWVPSLVLAILLAAPGATRSAATPTAPAAGALQQGDRAWAERAHRVDGEWRADAARVADAVESYRRAVDAAPDDLPGHRRLLTALYFQGEHVAAGKEERRRVFEQGKNAAEAALGRLADLAGADREAFRDLEPTQRAERLRAAGVDPEDAAALYFWSGVHWGLWGDAYGRLAAARAGVAGTVRDDALTALDLDPGVERAGPHRVLGRLHAEAPKIPFFTGWIDRDLAIAELEQAVEMAPEEPLNHVYLAQALVDYRPDRGEEARARLRALLDRPPEAARPVEGAAARREARRILQEDP